MRKIYVWMGSGYSLEECKILDSDIQEALERDNLEEVIRYLIDTEQVATIKVEDVNEEDLTEYGELEGYTYIDNTSSLIYGKDNCYYVLIENMKVMESEL